MPQENLKTNPQRGDPAGIRKLKMKMIMILAMAAFLTACGDAKVIDGVEYGTVGAFTDKQPGIEYQAIYGNAVWSVLLVETIILPIYFIGWSLEEPIGKKSDIRD